MSRTARVERKTAETRIELELSTDGTGQAQVATGIGFLDHMLSLLAKHAAVDLTVKAQGDLDVDQDDFAVFQKCISGEDNPADPTCAD